ncbi:MAG: hypothetical protein ACYC3W_02265 [Candidatus Nanopelagicales bacterium]
MQETNAYIVSQRRNFAIACQCCESINALDRTSFIGQDIPSWRAARSSLMATISACGYELQAAGGSRQYWAIKPMPQAAPMLRHFAVTGRIPGDDEDTLLTLQAVDREDAVDRFTNNLYDRETDPETSRRNVMEQFGEPIFITAVAASDSPIELVD